MEWLFQQRVVARAERVSVRLERVLRGFHLNLDLRLTTYEWPGWANGKGLDIVPGSAKLTALVGGQSVSFGYCLPLPATAVRVFEHTADATVTLVAHLSHDDLAAWEEQRRGRTFKFNLAVSGIGFVGGGCVGPSQRPLEGTFEINRDEWVAQLNASGFHQSLLVEIDLPDEAAAPELGEAVSCLRAAVQRRNMGDDCDSVAACRRALDALGQAGFGGHAPNDVVAFIKNNASRLAMSERFSVVQAALGLHFSPAAHPGTTITRDDATFALASTAALLRLALHRGKKT